MPFMYAEYMTKLMAPKPYPPQPRFDAPKLTPFFKPIDGFGRMYFQWRGEGRNGFGILKL